LSNLTLVLLAAGSSSRFELDVKKQWLRIDSQPLWQFVAQSFQNSNLFEKIVIASSADELEFMKNHADYVFVEGSTSRQKSLKNALLEVNTEYVLVSDVARSCVNDVFLNKIVSKKSSADCLVPYLPVTDTITYRNETIDRDEVKRIQTPQLSRTNV